MLAYSVSGQNLLPDSYITVFSLCSHKVEESREVPGVFFFLIRILILFITALPMS